MRIHVLNVGLGDSVVIESEINGKKFWSLVDCKKIGSHTPTVEFLKKHQISKIESIFLSHFHLDHISGLPDLVEYLEKVGGTLEFLVFPPVTKSKRIVIAFFKGQNVSSRATLMKKVVYALIRLKQTKNRSGENTFRSYFLFEKEPPDTAWKSHYHHGLFIAALSPNADMIDKTEERFFRGVDPRNPVTNSLSHCLLIREGLDSPFAFFPGDIEEGRVWRFVKNNIKKLTRDSKFEIGFIKMAHHGAWNEVYNTILPELPTGCKHKTIASISCPAGDPNHPHFKTLKLLSKEMPNVDIACTNLAAFCEGANSFETTFDLLSEREEIFCATCGAKNYGDGPPKKLLECAGDHQVTLDDEYVLISRQHQSKCHLVQCA